MALQKVATTNTLWRCRL